LARGRNPEIDLVLSTDAEEPGGIATWNSGTQERMNAREFN
jgi:hypothetical protein